MRNEVTKIIINTAKNDERLFLVAGDAGLGLWDEFKQNQRQYFNPGINEACSIGFCAGLALSGRKAIYYNIAPFVLMRPYEQVRNDICYQELPVILIAIGSGLTYAPSGITHYAVEDIGLALTLSNLQIFSPSDSIEARKSFEYAYKSDKPSYIRLTKANDPILHKQDIRDITSLQIHLSGDSDCLIISHSVIINELFDIAKSLNITLASLPFINSNNIENLNFMHKFKTIIVVEEHFNFGGLGSFLEYKLKRYVHKIGIKNHFIHEIGKQDFLRKKFHLDKDSLEVTINKIIKDERC